MKKSILYGLGLLVGVTDLNGMDNESLHPFFQLPSEVRGLIIDVAVDGKQKLYQMTNSWSENLLIPYTLRPINPIVSTNNGDAEPETWEPKEGAEILLDHQLWFSDEQKCIRVRLEHDSANNHDTIECEKEGLCRYALFDGINNKRCALLVLSANAAAEGSYVYFLRQSLLGKGDVTHKERKKKLFSLPGYIQSAMLHPDENRIVYSTKITVIDSDLPCYEITIIDVDDNDKENLIARGSLNVLIDKTIYLGENRYLGLTTEGKLAYIWLDKDNKLRHSMINLTKYDHDLKKNVPSDSVVKDIAVDDSCRTQTGLRPRIAYVTNKGEVFVMDLSLFKKPTPLRNMIVVSPESVFRLFYDKGELAVLYRDKQCSFKDFVRWPDNLGALYLKTVLAQQERSQHN